jgi:hypothetical protein
MTLEQTGLGQIEIERREVQQYKLKEINKLNNPDAKM